jgi:uncharacterized Zn finger protein
MARLTEQRLLNAAGEASFGRGEGYVRWVAGLRVVDDTASASVQGQRVYVVRLDWSKPGLRGECTCPHFDDGNFCKHLVAIGLAVIDQQGGDEPAGSAATDLLASLDADELREILTGLAAADPDIRRTIEIRVAAKSGDTETVGAELVDLVTKGLSTRGYVDYRRSFDVAADAQAVLDQLESHLDAGSADAVRPALLKAVTRLRKVVLNGDDSSGLMGDACQRAADLYARSCREGAPDGKKLATWLIKFRDESPGWPEIVLTDVVEAFDDAALAAYRRGVAKLDAKYAAKDHIERNEVDRMLLELADHDGDVDRAVELLSAGDHVQFGAIVERLRQAGREDEAVSWIDRAVAAGRLDIHDRTNSYWLGYDDVARTYRQLGRVDDAFAVLRDHFARQPGLATYRTLLDHAVEEGRWDGERTWALEQAGELASQRFGSGAALIEIALGEGDLDAAWAAATTYGAGHKWQALATASVDARPVDAAELYRPGIEKDLVHPNSELYPDIAKRLAVMRDLYAKGDRAEEFSEHVAELRERYKRRPSFMAALDRQRL